MRDAHPIDQKSLSQFEHKIKESWFVWDAFKADVSERGGTQYSLSEPLNQAKTGIWCSGISAVSVALHIFTIGEKGFRDCTSVDGQTNITPCD